MSFEFWYTRLAPLVFVVAMYFIWRRKGQKEMTDTIIAWALWILLLLTPIACLALIIWIWT